MTDVFVYLVATVQDGQFMAPVKVGLSVSPKARVEALQTACPFELGLVGAISYPTREIAMRMEDCFHSTQKEHRLRGEWFDIPPRAALDLLRLHARFIIEASDLAPEEKKTAVGLAEAGLQR